MKTTGFSRRRRPDIVAEEVVAVLMQKGTYGFKDLFDLVYARLLARNMTSGGEEMLRLRAYEKLQEFVHQGAVKKVGKEYTGVTSALIPMRADLLARAQAGAASKAAASSQSSPG